MTDRDPRPRVELIEFMGKNGGFAIHESRLWKVEIVGVNGHRHMVRDLMGGWGTIHKSYADKDARYWRDLLGCPLFERPLSCSGSSPSS